MSARLPAFALLLAVSASGCASLPFVRDDTESRRAEAERRIVELEKEATRSRIELERLRERLARLEGRAGAPAGTAAAPTAPVAAPVVPIREPESPAPSATDAIEQSDLEVAAPTAPAAEIAAPPSSAESAEYERALKLLREGDAAAAEQALATFVAARPDSELADNAWFWIGEARLVRQDVDGALAAYRTAVETHPTGNKTPDALFKIGHCLALQGDTARAGEVWSELARRFPQTAAAERALEGLAAASPPRP
jgi:tol-pal system protein YbgF